MWRGMPTLADRWSPKANSFGLLRVSMAFGVLLAHSWPLGFALPNAGDSLTAHQTDIGTLSLDGLVIVSGFLVTDSGLRFSLREYVWRRFIRIFPGLWTSLVVIALVIAPLVAIYENGNLSGFWTHHDGPFSYIKANALASMDQFSISGLLSGTPYGHAGGGPSAFQGSLWSLRYEFGCYVVIAILIATAAQRRWPRTVLVMAGVAYLLVLRDVFSASTWTIRPPDNGAIGPIPLVGSFAYTWTLYFGFVFLLGSAMRLYLHRVRMHRVLAAVAVLLIVMTMWRGGWLAIGLPAFAYLVIYLAVALPAPSTRLGRTRDYSFGLLLYGFTIQQVVALVGGARWGVPTYFLLSAVGTLACAVLSWHLVERPAMKLKDRKLLRRRRPELVVDAVVADAAQAVAR
jgi:peptidoglycan/LPS O-acetylase OafA/YrhL